MNGIAGMLLIQQIQAEQKRRDLETEEQLREQEDLKRQRQNKEHKEKQEAKNLLFYEIEIIN